jgi:hypothetical protein
MSEEPGIIADDEHELLAQAEEWPEDRSWPELTRSSLSRIADAQGLDFATALLYQRLRQSGRHGPFIRRVEELLSRSPRETGQLDVLLAIAPGAFYRELPGTGADGALLRRCAAACGCRTALIPAHSMGSVAENGRIICDWLAEQSHERIVLASVSKGGSDVKAALRERNAPGAFRPVVAWLNFCGITEGSPLANWLQRRKLATLFYKALFWWKGLDFTVTREMAWGPGSALDFALELPTHVQLITLIGFPLRRHLTSKLMRRCHEYLAPLGPNDGAILLAEACALPGLVYPVWGADHNLRPSWDIRRLGLALLQDLAATQNLWAGGAEGHTDDVERLASRE